MAHALPSGSSGHSAVRRRGSMMRITFTRGGGAGSRVGDWRIGVAPTAALADGATGGRVASSYIVTSAAVSTRARGCGRHARTVGAKVAHVYSHAVRGYAARLTADADGSLARDRSRVAAVVPDRRGSITAQTVPAGIGRVGADDSSTAAGDGRGRRRRRHRRHRHRDRRQAPRPQRRRRRQLRPGELSFDDLNGHGTHVAGTAAAKDNKSGVVGVAPGARLWAVRVLDAAGQAGPGRSIICGIDWVTAHADTIEVANMSLGRQRRRRARAPTAACARRSARRSPPA